MGTLVDPSVFREVLVNELKKPKHPEQPQQAFVKDAVYIAKMAEEEVKKHFKRGE